MKPQHIGELNLHEADGLRYQIGPDDSGTRYITVQLTGALIQARQSRIISRVQCSYIDESFPLP